MITPERTLNSSALADSTPAAKKGREEKKGQVAKRTAAPAPPVSGPSHGKVLDWLIDFFSSLRLTVFCLAVGLILVFVGTLAQVEIGLYKAQNEFFRSFFIYWGPKGAHWKIPVFPGGYLVGGVLLINLVTAHFRRFKLTRKKVGIWMIHIGVMLLLLGQLLTDVLSRESHMWLTEGQSKNYSDSTSVKELVVVDTSDPELNEVVAFPDSMVKKKSELRHPKLPFTIRVKEYLVNSTPRLRAPMIDTGPAQATEGVGEVIEFDKAPPTTELDAQDIPSVLVEVIGEKGSLGTWVLSEWITQEKLAQRLQAWVQGRFDDGTGSKINETLSQPQEFTYQERTYQIALRPTRYYKPFTIQLLDFKHDIYRGTDIPKNFSSRVRMVDPDKNEDREVDIYMNNPLRYSGETFYQAGFDDVDPHVTILQVVRNPSWLTPYFSCVLVGVGLIVQFCTSLFGFAFKRRKA
jgi:hypothetical protein